MRLNSLLSLLTFVPFCIAGTPSYFLVTSPVKNTTWTNAGLNVVRWTSAKEGITNFDIQLVRLSTDGVLPIAKSVPTSWSAFNVYLSNTPTGDDYFVLFLNSEDSSMYSISPRFQIQSNGTAAPSGAVKSDKSAIPTVTVSGAPNPTMQFAQTYAVSNALSLGISIPLMSIAIVCAVVGLASATSF